MPNQSNGENAVEKFAREMKVELPSVDLPIFIKLIALLTLIGGLSIIGGGLADIVRPMPTPFFSYLFRLLIGIGMVFIAHGIISRKRWTIWLYGTTVLVGLLVNPTVAFLPALITFYLYRERGLFAPSIFDRAAGALAFSVRSLLGRGTSGTAAGGR